MGERGRGEENAGVCNGVSLSFLTFRLEYSSVNQKRGLRGKIDCSISAFRISVLNKTCGGNRGETVYMSEAVLAYWELAVYLMFFIFYF